jgi:hypothetical protein
MMMARALSRWQWIGRTVLVGSVVGNLMAPWGCTPRIEVAPSDKPITINLNVKIDHEIRVKVDKELDNVLSSDSGLF